MDKLFTDTINDRLSAAALIYIFPVKDAAFIRERCLFQRRVKHLGAYIENKRSTY